MTTSAPSPLSLLRQGLVDECIFELSKTVSAYPKNFRDVTMSIGYGVLLAKSGRIQEGEEFLQELCKNRVSDSNVHRNLARVLNFSGQRERAKQHLTVAIALEPEQPLWVYHLAEINRCDWIEFSAGIFYFPIPKNASSSLKAVALELRGENARHNPHSAFNDYNAFFRTRALPESYGSATLRFVVVRDPAERILSFFSKNVRQRRALYYPEFVDIRGGPCVVRRVNAGDQFMGVDSLYGLNLQPSLAEFLKNFHRYCFCFNTVLHHTLPQVAFLPSDISGVEVYDLKEVDKVAQRVSDLIARDVSLPYLNTLSRQKAAESSFQKRDIRLVNRLLSEHFLPDKNLLAMAR